MPVNFKGLIVNCTPNYNFTFLFVEKNFFQVEKIRSRFQVSLKKLLMPTTNVSRSSNRPNVVIHGGNRLNFISSWFFLWIFQLLNISRKRNLGKDDLTLQDSETAKVVGDRLENFWKLECESKKNR